MYYLYIQLVQHAMHVPRTDAHAAQLITTKPH